MPLALRDGMKGRRYRRRSVIGEKYALIRCFDELVVAQHVYPTPSNAFRNARTTRQFDGRYVPIATACDKQVKQHVEGGVVDQLGLERPVKCASSRDH